jgi:hypothetical protein
MDHPNAVTKQRKTITELLVPYYTTEGTNEACLDQTKENAKHTAAGIPTWSPTVVLICRSTAYVWQSGRDAQFSADCGRMYLWDGSARLTPVGLR